MTVGAGYYLYRQHNETSSIDSVLRSINVECISSAVHIKNTKFKKAQTCRLANFAE